MGWLAPSPDGIAMCHDHGVRSHACGEDGEGYNDRGGSGKASFQVHGPTMADEVKFRKKLTRDQFRAFMAAQPAALVVFKACGSANYSARDMESLGHDVRLIAPQYVRPFVNHQKNDAANAEAIVIAARQPEMQFVAPKTAEQQTKAVVFRGREQLVHQRSEQVKALRAVFYEYGHVFPVGFSHLKRFEVVAENPNCGPPALVIAECQDLLKGTSKNCPDVGFAI